MFSSAVRGIAERLARGLGFSDGSLSAILADKPRRAVLCRAFDSEGSLEGPAGMVYRQAAELVTGRAQDVLPGEAVQRILKAFPKPMRFFNQVLKKVVCEGMNIERRDSVAFDVRISFLASRQASLLGAPVRLVTDDRLIHAAAHAAGVAHCVQHLRAYFHSLETEEEFA